MQINLSPRLLSQLQSYCEQSGVTTELAINRLLSSQLELENLNHEYLLSKYKAIADFNIADVVEWDGEMLTARPMSQWPKSCKGGNSPISSVSMSQFGIVIKAHDKLKALESIAKHLGLFGDFNIAIGTLKKYGIILKQHSETGEWMVDGGNCDPIQQELFISDV